MVSADQYPRGGGISITILLNQIVILEILIRLSMMEINMFFSNVIFVIYNLETIYDSRINRYTAEDGVV